MDALVSLLPLAALAALVDVPWLYATSNWSMSMLKRVQGGAPVRVRWEVAPIVYVAIAFLVQHTRNRMDAFWFGLCAFIIYDFSNYAVLSNYDLRFAVADSVWGGTLFVILRELGLRLNLL